VTHPYTDLCPVCGHRVTTLPGTCSDCGQPYLVHADDDESYRDPRAHPGWDCRAIRCGQGHLVLRQPAVTP
jgi:predicted amidophosphoribosyltransferase